MDAVQQMQFEDAQKILKGPRSSARHPLFQNKTSGRLRDVEPIIRDSMNQVGVTRQYQDLNAKASALPMGGSLGLDLDRYVTEKGLKGLFTMWPRRKKDPPEPGRPHDRPAQENFRKPLTAARGPRRCSCPSEVRALAIS